MLKESRAESSRRYYENNKEAIKEASKAWKKANPEKVAAARRRAKKPPTAAELRKREQRRLKRAQEAAQRRQEWKELGWIVAKMNIKARLTQDQIYKLLGGLASREKIREWCARGKKLNKLVQPK